MLWTRLGEDAWRSDARAVTRVVGLERCPRPEARGGPREPHGMSRDGSGDRGGRVPKRPRESGREPSVRPARPGPSTPGLLRPVAGHAAAPGGASTPRAPTPNRARWVPLTRREGRLRPCVFVRKPGAVERSGAKVGEAPEAGRTPRQGGAAGRDGVAGRRLAASASHTVT